MPEPDPAPGTPRHIHLGPEEKKTNWLAWLALLLGLLALLFFLTRSCSRHDAVAPVAVDNSTAMTNTTETTTNTTAPVVAAKSQTVSQVGTFLAGTEVAPRTFTFQNINFDTSKSVVKPGYEQEVADLAAVMAKYPNAKGRIVGYADARGSDPANMKLGQARADAVKAALVAKGVAADRLETASGGEHDPVDTNATAQGQAENRRTEFVITSR